MPLVFSGAVTRLSSTWTPQRVISEVRVLTRQLGNEIVQDMNIRNHINVAVSNIAEMLNMAKHPHYGIVFKNSTIEAGTTPPEIDLGALFSGGPFDGLAGQQVVWEITRISTTQNLGGSPAVTRLHNVISQPLDVILNLNGNTNIQTQYDMFWEHHGSRILFYIPPVAQLGFAPTTFDIWAIRNPLLDDYTNTGLTTRIDLPDRYVRLLILMVQKMVLEQANQQSDPNLDANISNLTQQIANNIAQETQFIQATRVNKMNS